MTPRRIALGCASLVVVLAAATAALWYLWFPHYRPDLGEDERYGVDVASHQGAIDWEAVAADDISFAYIKATEGGDFTDGRFDENWDGARAAGLDVGAYHFFTLCTPGAEQADHFLATVADGTMLPSALDLELAGNCSQRPRASDVAAEVDTFLAAVEAEMGEEVVLYVGDDWERAYPTRARLDRSLWHRRILFRETAEDWTIWQFTGWGRVDGIDGSVDINVMRPRP